MPLKYDYMLNYNHLLRPVTFCDPGCLLMFILGTAATWTSPVIPKLKDPNESPFDIIPSNEDLTWIASIFYLGAACGTIIFNLLANQWGRRLALITLGVLALVSYLLLGFLQTIAWYYAARLLLGCVLGGVSSQVPMYLAEILNKSHRAALIAFASFSFNGGCLFSYILGPYVKVNIFNIVLAMFPVAFLVIFLFYGVETAQFFVVKGNETEARLVLRKLRGPSHDIEIELKEMTLNFEEQCKGDLFENLHQKAVLKAFRISTALFVFQQFSGYSYMLSYTESIFGMTGSGIDAKICSIIIGSVQLITSMVAILTAHKFGRKPLLICSSIGMVAALVPFGVYFYLRDLKYDVENFSFVPLLCLSLTAVVFNNGLGPIPWAISAEIFPSRVKSLGSSLGTGLSWTLGFIIVKYSENLTQTIGLGQAFLCFAFFCGLSAVFVSLYVIETKGKSLEEIQKELSEK